MNITIDFTPNLKQTTVLSEFYYDPKISAALMIGGVRAGKTTLGHKLGLIESVRYNVPVNILIARATHDEAIHINAEHMLREFKKEEREVIADRFNRKDGIMTMPNGSMIYFWGLGKDGEGRDMFDKVESMEFSFAFIDDARKIPSKVFNYIVTRMSGVGSRKILLSTNPPPETHWLYREFVTKAMPDRKVFHFNVYDNQDNLPADYIEKLQNLPPSYRKVYVEGQWGSTWEEGGVFDKEFNYEVHIDKEYGFDDSIVSSRILGGIDFGFHYPAMCLIQAFPDRTFNIFHEFLGKDMKIFDFFDEIGRQLKEKYNLGMKNVMWFGDVAGKQVNSIGENDYAFIRKRFGLNIIGKKLGINDSILNLRNMLVQHIGKRPQLGIHPSCEAIINGFLGGYRVDEKGRIVKDGDTEHVMDSVRYALSNFTPYVDRRRDYGRFAGGTSGATPTYLR